MFRTLGLITARGGSKGIPRKNIRPLMGQPLLQYTADAALGAKLLSRVVLTTEDEEIAAVGRNCGLEVPFLRPAALAQDDTPTLPVVQHAVRTLEERGDHFDAVCLLQPTNPLRQTQEIDACIELLTTTNADCVITVLAVPPEYNPHWVFFRGENGLLHLSTGESAPIPRRQLLPPAFHREGSVYVTKRDTIMNGNSLFGEKVAGYLMDKSRSVNIDTMADWSRAEALLRHEDAAGVSGKA